MDLNTLKQYDQSYFQSLPNVMSTNTTNPLDNMLAWRQKGLNFAGSQFNDGGIFSGKSLFGGEGSTGWLAPAMQGVGSILGGWTGMQQLDLAREQLAFQKQAFQANLANQTQLTNQALIDRQQKRANASSAYASPDEQWKKTNLLPANK